MPYHAAVLTKNKAMNSNNSNRGFRFKIDLHLISYQIQFSIMKKNLFYLLLVSLLFACGSTATKKISVNPAFSEYIGGFTTGVLSKESNIRVMLSKPVTDTTQITDDLISFEPPVAGKVKLVAPKVLEFQPEEPFQSGANYSVSFNLGKLEEVPEDLETFNFEFQVLKQTLSVYVDGLTTYDANKLEDQKLQGRLVTSDLADSNGVKKSLQAFQDGNQLEIYWNHDGGNRHRFEVAHVQRKKEAGKIKLVWNGKAIHSDDKGEKEITVPALGDFFVTEMTVVHEPEQYVRIHFSDPIQPQQDLDGLVSIDRVRNVRFEIEGHDIKAYLPSRLSGTRTVKVERGIRNINGYKMKNPYDLELLFEGIKPNVRFVSDGVVLPRSGDKFVLPFEAVNLKSVDVLVTQIHEENMVQFLQVNSLQGSSQIKRVGKRVMRKKVDLLKAGKDVQTWNKYFLDLTDLIKDEPGTLYQIELKLRQAYSAYGCDGKTEELQAIELEEEEDSWTESDWATGYYYDDYYYDDYDYYDSYDYRERKNPCHPSYYRDRGVITNLVASDLGMIAKAGADKTMHIMVSSIATASPLKGVEVEFYDFQQQKLASAFTDADGMVSMKLETKPFVAIAKKGSERGFLKLRDGEALSMSKFEVNGATVQKGVKGFMYTERGVRRPGDSIYVSFLLEDKNHILPVNHPVKFKLFDPKGRVVESLVSTRGVNGMYAFRMKTEQEDPTGNYRAEIRVGNRLFNKYLKVETVKPNRLKVHLDFKGEMLSHGEEHMIELSSKWLHGANAGNLKAKVDLTLNASNTAFSDYKGYQFTDPLKSFSASEETVFEGHLDDEGKVAFSPELFVGSSAPGMLMANFTTKVFEAGGGFSINWSSVKYSPYQSYVGVKVPEGELYRGTLVTDKDHTFRIATVDEDGKPVSKKGLDVKVYKLEWSWWWDRYDTDLYSYISREGIVPVFNKKISSKNGKASFQFRVDRPSWGRYLVRIEDPESGHVTGKIFYVDWPYWARSNRTENEHATMLSFSSDKETYTTGEPVKISFPSPAKGRALISIESGAKIVKKYWIDTEKGETKFEFQTTAEMSPNVFVNVSLLQPHAATQNDLPLRMYGVIPITVENPDTHLQPKIETQKVWKPETAVSVSVSEEKGKPMTYTLAIVDDGLLDLTGFKTPAPWDHFYAKEALGVKTWDYFDQVIGAFGQEMDQLLAVGGDAEGGKKKPAKANRFKPMVKFIGPFQLPAGSKKKHKIEVPNYVGSVRVMVVAGQDERYGHAEKTIPVRSPLMVLGTLPRVLGPGETIYLPVNVFAMEKHVKDVSVSIESNELLKVNGSGTKKVTFAKPGDQVISFPLTVSDKIGIGKVKIVAKSGNEISRYEVELDVRTPNPVVADIQEVVLEPGGQWTPEFAFRGVEGTNTATLEVSAIPPINLDKRLKYLIRYPHGCIEQTTSAAFPQLFVDDLMDLNNNYQIELDRNIKQAIQRLQLFQTSDGGFSYWPGHQESNAWGTNYGGHFLLEAKKQGYNVPDQLISNWASYQRRKARNWRHTTNTANFHGHSHYEDLTQAYRLYTLALANRPELGAMNRMKEQKDLSITARWRLAGAYAILGRTEVAHQLIQNATLEIAPYRELSYSYGSDWRDKAMILEVLAEMNQKTKGGLVAKELAERMNSEEWMSTQTTAYCLIGMSKFIGVGAVKKVMNFSYQVNGQKIKTKRTEAPVFRQDLPVSKSVSAIQLNNNGKGTLYARLIVEGSPVTGDQSTASNNVNIDIRYTDMKGIDIDPVVLEQGTDFIAEVTVRNPGFRGDLREMTLNQIFPSGWEIHNARMQGFASATETSYADYQDVRDDRVYTYYRLNNGRAKVFRIKLNATYLGRFYLPTVETEAMYDNTIHARQAGKWIEVVSSGDRASKSQ